MGLPLQMGKRLFISVYFGCFDTCPCSCSCFPSNPASVAGGSQPTSLQPHELSALNESACMVHVFLVLPWLWEMGTSHVDYARSKWQHALCQLSCAGRHSLGWKESCGSSPPLCPLPAYKLPQERAEAWGQHVKSRHWAGTWWVSFQSLTQYKSINSILNTV